MHTPLIWMKKESHLCWKRLKTSTKPYSKISQSSCLDHACRPFNHHRNDMTLLLAQYQVNSRPPSSVCATTQLQLAKTKLAMEQVRIVEEKQRLERLKAESKAPAKPQKTLALGFAGSIGACLIDAWWIFFAHPSRNNCVAILQNLRLDGVIIIIIIIIKPATRRSHSVPSRRTP